MTENKFTPGPWVITQKSFNTLAITIRHDGIPICTINGQHYPLQVFDNAVLISAAPELLHELEMASELLDALRIESGIGKFLSESEKRVFESVDHGIKTIIAKACGGL